MLLFCPGALVKVSTEDPGSILQMFVWNGPVIV